MNKVEQIDLLLNLLINRHSQDGSQETSSVEDSFKLSFTECKNYIESHEECSWILNYPDIELSTTGDYYWEFVKLGLKILKCLKYFVLDDEVIKSDLSERTPILNVKQQNCIKSLCDFIMCLGVGRNLLPGVGIPWESRSKFISLILKDHPISQKQLQLYSTLKVLMEISQYPIIGNMLFSQCLQDLLAGLCQLAFWQLHKVKDQKFDVEKMNDIKKSSLELLHNVLERAYQPKVIKELLFLQGSAKPSACSTNFQNAVVYLRKAVSKLLLERVMKKQGVKSLIMAILESGENDEKLEQRNWMKYEIAARLISSFTTNDKHNAFLGPQILELLNDDSHDKESKHQFIRTGKLIVVNIASKNSQLADHMIFHPLFKVLIDWSTNEDHSVSFDKNFEDCITKLHNIFTFDAGFSKKFIANLSQVIGILFCVYSFLKDSILHVKTLIEQILISYFKNVGETDLISISKQILFHFDKTEHQILLWNPRLNNIESEQMETEPLEWIQTDHLYATTFCSLIEKLKDDKLAANIFLWVLQNLSLSFDAEVSNEQTREQSQLIQIEEDQTIKEINLRKLLISLNILSTLLGEFEFHDALLEHKTKILAFIESILERGAKHCQSAEVFKEDNSETLQLALSILPLVTNEKDQTQTKSIINSLKILSEKHSNENIKLLTGELYKYYLTMGAVPISQENIKSFSQIKIDDANTPSTSQTKDDIKLSPYQQLWIDLNDEDIPTKGHALITCTKLLQNRDETIMKDKEILLPLLIESLAHSDSYIYLLCTRTLASLAAEFPNFVMETLLIKYGDDSNPVFQMKIGEVLLKFVSLLNELVVIYRNPLINTFMNVTLNSRDPLIRASGLSNLGELLKGLKYSLGPNVEEIFVHLSDFAKCDPNYEVRSAAVQVFTLLLRGLGKDSLTVLETIYKKMYELLKDVYKLDKDERVKLQAQLALDELDIICRAFLLPEQKLEKKISILK